MEIKIYCEVKGDNFNYLHWRVFKLVRWNGNLMWDCEDVFIREQFIKDRYPGIIKYPSPGRVSFFPFNQEKFEKALGAHCEH